MRPKQKAPTSVQLKNRFNNELTSGNLVEMTVIDGKEFFVLEFNGRLIKLAKDGYTIVHRKR